MSPDAVIWVSTHVLLFLIYALIWLVYIFPRFGAWLYGDNLLFDTVEALNASFDAQKREDLFELWCQSCGGGGIEMDLSEVLSVDSRGNRWFGGKVCAECGGRGY